MAERILFLTGRLAKPRLEKVLKAMQPSGFEYLVHDYYGEHRGPFRLAPETRAFPLVHAVRLE